jgi:hypothetical protein
MCLKSFMTSTLIAVSLTAWLQSEDLSHSCLNRQKVLNTTTTIHVGSAVEPTIAVNPKHAKHMVAAWQQNRISNGGALEAGIAYSWDFGKTWKKSKVPFQICERGFIQRVSDLWLSFSKDGSKVFLTALVINATYDRNTFNQSGIVVTSSEDGGAHFSHPVFLAANQNRVGTSSSSPFDDKPSITADRNNKHFAYSVWSEFDTGSSFHASTFISRTKNGGESFLPHKLLYDPFPDLTAQKESNGDQNDCSTTNNVIVVLPKEKEKSQSGHLVNFMVRQYATPNASDEQYVADRWPFQFTLFDIATVRSKDHGENWSLHAHVVKKIKVNQVFTGGYTYSPDGQITGGVGTRIRTGENDNTPSYNVNPTNGFLYVVWQTGKFRHDKLPQIALTRSRDGGHTWSKAVRVSRTPTTCPNPQAFTPFVAVAKDGMVGVLYYDLRHDDKQDASKTKIDAWLAIYQEVKHRHGGSTKIGLKFVKEVRLTKKSFIVQNGPTTDEGVMCCGDYPFLAALKDTFYAAFTKSLKKDFRDLTPFFNDNANKAVILLDKNFRQAVEVGVVKRARLVKRIRMPFKHKKVHAHK